MNRLPKQVGPFESTSGIEVISDNFGGYLFFYKDGQGNRCVTNNIDDVYNRSRILDVKESVSSSTVSRQDEEATLLKISELKEKSDELSDSFESDETQKSISDPLEPINRLFFHFNDKLYFWFLKPAATGYKAVVPEPIRGIVQNFFYNLAFPARFVNCLLQAKFKSAGQEISRFMVNSTGGFAGFFDIATTHCNIKRYEEDFGQTLGNYGMGPAFFIYWPIFGPSNVRDTVGLVGDSFLDPLNYMVPRTKYNAAVKGYKVVNKTSFTIGEYEDLKKAALDPYISIRDAYFQHRQSEIKE
ncbi:VacJ family lipoprotein [Thermodesulfobacteriota bacterium]